MIKANEFDMETDPDYEALKATDLRIGNYYGYAHEEGLSYKQADIDFIKTQQEYNEDPDADQFSRGWWAFPIPLTEEWLVRLGWTEQRDDMPFFKYGNGELYWFPPKTNKEYSVEWFQGCAPIFAFKVKIKYVHELQNFIYAVTGEELTLK
jgi:hypothetical protein